MCGFYKRDNDIKQGHFFNNFSYSCLIWTLCGITKKEQLLEEKYITHAKISAKYMGMLIRKHALCSGLSNCR
jgi:thymidylate synthase